MAEKIKKGIPWFLVILLFGLVITVSLEIDKPIVEATTEQATTTVTVGNAAPTFTYLYENPESSTSSPTNVGVAVTFETQVSDPNGDGWWFLVCSTATQIATTSDGSSPDCPSSLTWASSTATSTDDATTSLAYTTLAGDAESEAWWGWACDDVSGGNQLCSSVSQGTGGSDVVYSPFAVNHQPSYTALDDNGPIDPGGSVTITASAADADTGGGDWLQLFVCKADDGTSSGCGGGGTWCSATSTTPNVSCTYDDSAPTVDQAYNYWGYIFDQHNFAASPASRTDNFVVSNVAPTISLVSLNDATAIDLTEESTTSVEIKGTINDNNSCNDLSSATARSYRQASSSVCTAQDDNFCYYNISCTIGACGGTTDVDATTTCTAYMWYHTDATVASSTWNSDIWDAEIKAVDDNDASSTATTSTPVELNTLLGIDIDTGAISYGAVGAGSDTGTLSATSTLAGTGNVSLDVDSTSTDMTGPSTIAVGYQEFSISSGISYGSGTDASTSIQEIELNLAKTNSTSSQATANVYWGIAIPEGSPAGDYTGYTSYQAKLNELPW
ncbi:MAG: hypothetical protein ABIA11_00050 [Patescibacteria group bacterium]